MADDQGEKTEEPSQHKLDEARKKGDVASSKELNSVLILAGTLCVLIFSSLYTFEIIYEFIGWIYTLDYNKVFTEDLGKKVLSESLFVIVKCTAPTLATSLCLGILAQVSQVGLLYAPDVLTLKFERVNPLSGFKRLFSKKSLVEALKGVFKFMIVLGITYFIFSKNVFTFNGLLHTETAQAVSYGKSFILKLSLSIMGGLVIVALGDFIWEKYAYKQKHRMTKQEVKEENKSREGSPEIKQRIRSIQREMASKRMMNDVKSADVIITNPTHISIVVKYDSQTMIAPEVVGKGSDELALRIREIAKENDIPIVENVPLARALHKTVKVGEGVPRALYQAVAQILAFVYKEKRKKQALS